MGSFCLHWKNIYLDRRVFFSKQPPFVPLDQGKNGLTLEFYFFTPDASNHPLFLANNGIDQLSSWVHCANIIWHFKFSSPKTKRFSKSLQKLRQMALSGRNFVVVTSDGDGSDAKMFIGHSFCSPGWHFLNCCNPSRNALAMYHQVGLLKSN